jgi:uncharacterized membrane protein
MRIHIIICAVFIFFFAITQSYYGRKFYCHRNKKNYRQYKLINTITAIILFLMFIVAIIHVYFFKIPYL